MLEILLFLILSETIRDFMLPGVLLFVYLIVCMVMSYQLASAKGYNPFSHAAIAFFLGGLQVLFLAGLPDRFRNEEDIRF